MWTLEPWPFDWLYFILFLGIAFFLIMELAKLCSAWIEFRKLLRALDSLFLRRTFRSIHGLSWKRLWSIGSGSGYDANRAFNREITAWGYAVNVDATKVGSELKGCNEEVNGALSSLKDLLDDVDQNSREICDPSLNRNIISKLKQLRVVLGNACALSFVSLREIWKREQGPHLYDSDNPDPKSDAEPRNPETKLREQFVAFVYVNFIVTILLRMRTLIMNIAGIYICVLLSLSCYPFEPKVVLRPVLILSFFAIVALIGWVYAQMHRDATLSRLTDTTPGELGSDFYWKMAGFVILPLMSLLVSQFPDINNFLFSWIQPAFQSISH
jgi:hypothetical protein